MKIEGRTFVVSGGASGLGRACVVDICQNGGYAAILDMNEELAEELVKEISGGKTKFFQTNVLETESITAAVKGALDWVKVTGKEVGGVIAAAGVSKPAKILDRNLEPFSLSDFDFVMNVNVRGTIDLIRQVLPHMARSEPQGQDGERGVIIMVASSAAFDGQPGQGTFASPYLPMLESPLTLSQHYYAIVLSTQSYLNFLILLTNSPKVAYAASKGAIRSLTLPLTRDLARHGIRVVTIAPSLFDSRMTAMMSEKVRASLTRVMEFPTRPGQPSEFASLVRHGIENIMLNGVVLRLDGGMRMPSKM